MGDCNTCKGEHYHRRPNEQPIQPPAQIEGIITKKTCPKCNYWMSLVLTPATKERSYLCQNSLCRFVMPFSSPSPSV